MKHTPGLVRKSTMIRMKSTWSRFLLQQPAKSVWHQTDSNILSSTAYWYQPDDNQILQDVTKVMPKWVLLSKVITRGCKPTMATDFPYNEECGENNGIRNQSKCIFVVFFSTVMTRAVARIFGPMHLPFRFLEGTWQVTQCLTYVNYP